MKCQWASDLWLHEDWAKRIFLLSVSCTSSFSKFSRWICNYILLFICLIYCHSPWNMGQNTVLAIRIQDRLVTWIRYRDTLVCSSSVTHSFAFSLPRRKFKHIIHVLGEWKDGTTASHLFKKEKSDGFSIFYETRLILFGLIWFQL